MAARFEERHVPEDVLHCVFDYLGYRELVWTVANVCRAWRAAVLTHQCKCAVSAEHGGELKIVAMRMPLARRLKGVRSSAHVWDFKKLEAIEVHAGKLNTMQMQAIMAVRAPELKVIRACQVTCDAIAACDNLSLRDLDLHLLMSHGDPSRESLVNVVKSAPNLRKFRMSGVSFFCGHAEYERLLAHLSNLRVLEIHSCQLRTSHKCLQAICECGGALLNSITFTRRFLNAAQTPSDCDAYMLQMTQSFTQLPSLRRLCVRNCGGDFTSRAAITEWPAYLACKLEPGRVVLSRRGA